MDAEGVDLVDAATLKDVLLGTLDLLVDDLHPHLERLIRIYHLTEGETNDVEGRHPMRDQNRALQVPCVTVGIYLPQMPKADLQLHDVAASPLVDLNLRTNQGHDHLYGTVITGSHPPQGQGHLRQCRGVSEGREVDRGL